MSTAGMEIVPGGNPVETAEVEPEDAGQILEMRL